MKVNIFLILEKSNGHLCSLKRNLIVKCKIFLFFDMMY